MVFMKDGVAKLIILSSKMTNLNMISLKIYRNVFQTYLFLAGK